MAKVSIESDGDRHVVVKRHFVASPEAVYRAHTDAALIQRWMLGPEGWTMPVCICDPRPGGEIRYEWSNGQGATIKLTGSFIELVPFSRLMHVERMHMPDPLPENHVTTTFTFEGTGTLVTVRMTLPDARVRAAVLASGMEHGLEASYGRLENMLER